MLDMLMQTRWLSGMATLLLAGVLAAPATAGVAYKWTDASGNLSFTDDTERIPEQFRAVAERIEMGSLSEYGRLSPQRFDATEDRVAELQARTERLRKMAETADQERAIASFAAAGGQVSPGAAGTTFSPTVDIGGSTIRIPGANPDKGPIVVEQTRAVRRGKIVTQTATVVRQGDEVLMIVYPSQPQGKPNEFIREDDLMRGRD